MRKVLVLALSSMVLFSLGCASTKIKRAELPENADPQTQVAQLQERVEAGYGDQLDVLAPKDFTSAQEWLTKSQKGLDKGADREDVLNDVSYGLAFMDRASASAETHRGHVQAVLDARQSAQAAGARDYGETRREIYKLDNDFRAEAPKFESFGAEKQSELQREYLALELKATQNTQLDSTRNLIDAAINNDARKRVPNTLEQAQIDLRTAENVIAAERRTPEAYAPAVKKAQVSAQNLTEILKMAKDSGKNTSEGVAISLWEKEKRIGALQGNLASAERSLTEVSGVATAQAQVLEDAESRLSFQQGMDEIRKEFGRGEADVYQQGDKLIIRLKKMNFASGRSDIPGESMPVLSKVNEVIQRMDPRSVMVEGHTDSTGSKAINQELSQQRADSVAEFFKSNGLEEIDVQSVGYGFEKPIASNKSKDGRASNRRVDVVIEANPSVTQ